MSNPCHTSFKNISLDGTTELLTMVNKSGDKEKFYPE